jgi:hypothetical protein
MSEHNAEQGCAWGRDRICGVTDILKSIRPDLDFSSCDKATKALFHYETFGRHKE